MRRVLAAVLLCVCSSAMAQSDLPERFGLSATTTLFDKIRFASGFDLSRPATFGYFFNTPSPDRLGPIRAKLEADGFAFVETHVDRQGRTWLQMAKTQIHTPESMVDLNRKLNSLADEAGDVRYDGWDIGKNAR